MTDLVSVIIPVYNSESYIGQCIQSLIDQSFRKMEIIVIDDGSEDRSAEICRELSRSDDRIMVIEQEHKGVSAARNKGMELASGEFVFFLDSDDMIHPRLIEEYGKQMKEYQVDLVFCPLMMIKGEMKQDVDDLISPKWKIIDGIQTEEWFHLEPKRELSAIGGKMVRRTAVGSLRFDESLFVGEDTTFLYCLCCRQIKMAYLSQKWYYYRIHGESISHSYARLENERYFSSYEIIRDSEYRRGHIRYASFWQYRLVLVIMEKYFEAGKIKNGRGKRVCRILGKRAFREMCHPLFRELPAWIEPVLLVSLLFRPVYFLTATRLRRVMYG